MGLSFPRWVLAGMHAAPWWALVSDESLFAHLSWAWFLWQQRRLPRWARSTKISGDKRTTYGLRDTTGGSSVRLRHGQATAHGGGRPSESRVAGGPSLHILNRPG